jgi:dienelactone hydrolase
MAPPTVASLTTEQRQFFFAYDKRLELDAVERELEAPQGMRCTAFEFQSTHGQRVPGRLWTPARGGPFPLVVIQHGTGGHKNELYISGPAAYWGQNSGWAVLAIDAPRHGERSGGAVLDIPTLWSSAWGVRDHQVQLAQDLMRTLDYAETKSELDLSRVGYLGLSMGTIFGVAFVALDSRVGSAVFAIGGSVTAARLKEFSRASDDEIALVESLVDPTHFAPLISPRPVLMICGRQDDIAPPAACQKLFDALGEPKRIEWYDGGHVDMRGSEFKLIRQFFSETLG